MQTFVNTLADKFSLSEDELNQLMDTFMAALPKSIAESLGKCA